ncbi:MAG TPA: hypothetical protein VLA34_09655 [Candidatus Krumholzibacterium sp.]|nr:hypothetical protein [Candidatus Krumholzibacterium sp.]
MKLRSGWLILLFIITVHTPAWPQELPPADLPPEIAAPLRDMRFPTPTRIEAFVLFLDTYDPAIWVELRKVFADGSWKAVPEGRQFILYPRDEKMMAFLKTLEKGTELRVIVQRAEDGKVRILSFDDL